MATKRREKHILCLYLIQTQRAHNHHFWNHREFFVFFLVLRNRLNSRIESWAEFVTADLIGSSNTPSSPAAAAVAAAGNATAIGASASPNCTRSVFAIGRDCALFVHHCVVPVDCPRMRRPKWPEVCLCFRLASGTMWQSAGVPYVAFPYADGDPPCVGRLFHTNHTQTVWTRCVSGNAWSNSTTDWTPFHTRSIYVVFHLWNKQKKSVLLHGKNIQLSGRDVAVRARATKGKRFL